MRPDGLTFGMLTSQCSDDLDVQQSILYGGDDAGSHIIVKVKPLKSAVN